MRPLTVLAYLCLLSFAGSTSAIELPPQIQRDEGACPGEGCRYGEWKAIEETSIYSKPDGKSAVIKIILKGESVIAETGFVTTKPGQFIVTKNEKDYKPGDVLWLYTYLGEGFFKIWHNGQYREEDFHFSYWDEKKKNDWGYVKIPPDSEWWIKIVTRDGSVGWTNKGHNFCSERNC